MEYSKSSMAHTDAFVRQSRVSRLDQAQPKPFRIKEKIIIFLQKIYRCLCCCIAVSSRNTEATETEAERFIPKQEKQPSLKPPERRLIHYVKKHGNIQTNPTLELAIHVLKNEHKKTRASINIIEDRQLVSANTLIDAIDAQNSEKQREIALLLLKNEQRRILSLKNIESRGISS